MATLRTDRTSSSLRAGFRSPLNLVATGWAMTSALVGIFVICEVLAGIWPTALLSHSWISLFATEPDNIAKTSVEGVFGSAVAAWIAALLFVPVYNRMAER